VPIVYGAYPITPASGILEELAMHKRFRIRTIQAEDEIAAVTAAIGASFGGRDRRHRVERAGHRPQGEGIGLAVTAELPLVIFDIQRGGPSTGLPTKTEQADLMQALYGRNSESPIVVLAPATPGDCFYVAYEAVRIAVKYMVPVMVLSDGFLANGSEPWRIPDPSTLPPIDIHFRTEQEGFFRTSGIRRPSGGRGCDPARRGSSTGSAGIEKQDVTGNISYDPEQPRSHGGGRAPRRCVAWRRRSRRRRSTAPQRASGRRRVGGDVRRDHRGDGARPDGRASPSRPSTCGI